MILGEDDATNHSIDANEIKDKILHADIRPIFKGVYRLIIILNFTLYVA